MTRLIAHRGVSAEAPENTLEAIKLAIDLGFEWVEMDLHLSQEGIPVIIHDSTLSRTTNTQEMARVEDLPLSELKKLDAGSWFSDQFCGAKIPTLDEVLRLERKSTKFMLEIKKGIADPLSLATQIKRCLPESDPSLLIGSFDPAIVNTFLSSNYPVIGIAEDLIFVNTFLEMGVKHLALWSRCLEPGLIKRLQEDGIKIWVFTVDDIKTAQLLTSVGVDGIISNNPRLLRAHLPVHNESA